MVALTALLLPIVVSAVFVFFVSSIVHMMLGYHAADMKPLPRQDDIQTALRAFDIPPGDYMLPRPANMKDMRSPEFVEKRAKGPVIVMTVMQKGASSMGPQLLQWFGYSLLVNLFAGYVAGRALPSGSPYLHVFRFVGTVAFAGYALALWQDSIWYKRSWGTTLRYTFDGLVYACVTAGTFGWLWPK